MRGGFIAEEKHVARRFQEIWQSLLFHLNKAAILSTAPSMPENWTGERVREFVGVAARQAPSVYFSAASFEVAIVATSVLGLSFCNCS